MHTSSDAQPVELGDPRGDLLERADPVTQPRGVLEAQGAREARQPGPQRRKGRLEVVPVEVPERARGELGAALARDRAEACRLGDHGPALAATAEVGLRPPTACVGRRP